MNKLSFIPAALLATGVVLSMNSMPADAFSIGFNNVTNNTSPNVAPDFNVSVDDIGNGQVKFTFNNTGQVAPASITDIYFGKSDTFPTYLGTTATIGSTGTVSFSQDASPPNPPQGQFQWQSAYSADADAPSGYNKNGVDVGENVSFTFALQPGASFNDLQNLYNNGTLVIALHAQSIGGSGGNSDWFGSHTSVTSNDIPEPLTILGTGAAVGFAGLFRREQSKRLSKVQVKVKA
ncbi:MAG TPA: PEP-CTERM sorting domain-containing protein [Chroococcales cyanobacterium]|jgi:hypothetical protein